MIDRLRALYRHPWSRRAVLGVYVALLFATIAVYIGLSTLDVHTAGYFRGASELERGRPNAVRGVILNARTGKFRREVEVAFWLRERGSGGESGDEWEAHDVPPPGSLGRDPLAEARPGPGGLVHTVLQVPEAVEAGDYELVVRADGPGIDAFSAATPVTVAAASDEIERWLPAVSRVSDPERRQEVADGPVVDRQGDLAVDLLPPDGEAPRGLPTEMHLVTYDAETGEPVEAAVTFEETEGLGQWGQTADLPDRVETDAMGVAPVSVEAAGGQEWTVSAEELGGGDTSELRRGEATFEIHTVASQLSLSLERPYVGPRGRLRGRVYTLFVGDELLVDLYRGAEWLMPTSFALEGRSGRFEFEPTGVEPSEEWLYRLQLSRDFYGAGEAWDAAHLVALEEVDESALREALGRTAELVAGHRDESPYFRYVAEGGTISQIAATRTQLEGWLTAYLEALPRHFARPGTLFNTQERDRERLEAWADELQSDLLIVIVIAFVGGFAVLAYVIVVGVRRTREHDRQLRAVDDELAVGEAENGEGVEPESGGGLGERLQAVLLGLVGVATLVMFALGLILLLSYM